MSLEKTLIRCSIKDLSEIKFFLVEDEVQHKIWSELVNNHHYLGYKKMIGRRLQYLCTANDQILSAISFKSGYKSVFYRDNYIGWDSQKKNKNLGKIINNNRFLIPEWVTIPNLASYILSRIIKIAAHDWEKKYNEEILLCETYVDPERFAGTCYKASNWIYVGKTQGYTTIRNKYIYHGKEKDIYVYPLKRTFRKELGCKKCIYPLNPEKSHKRERRLNMLLYTPDYDPALIDWSELNEEMIKKINDKLFSFHKDFFNCFFRVEQEILGQSYLQGLLSDVTRKNIEKIVLEYSNPSRVRSHQKFLSDYKWNDRMMIAEINKKVAALLSSVDGMLTLDESDIPKKGKESVGVARQYCGNTGKIDNCQAGIFLGYSSSKGYALLEKELFLPALWFSDEYAERRIKTKIPEGTKFRSKLEIAEKMILKKIEENNFLVQWVGFDATFGISNEFRSCIAKTGCYYFADIKKNTLIFTSRLETEVPEYKGRGRKPTKERICDESAEPAHVQDIANNPDEPWKIHQISEGANGPIFAEVLMKRIYVCNNDIPAEEVWLFIRKDFDGKVRYSLSNAPVDISEQALISASALRWPIEQCFEIGKKHLGMDHYENRSQIGRASCRERV